MRNPNKPIRYFGELQKLTNGSYKIVQVKKLVTVNQHKRSWEQVSARQFSRDLNKSNLVIN